MEVSSLQTVVSEDDVAPDDAGGRDFGWFTVVRLGLVQAALGAVVVLTTSTFNRVMVVELSLAAMVPGVLVTLHHAMQLLRPRMGHGTDVGRRCTPWIVFGMLALAVGGTGAAIAVAIMAQQLVAGLVLATLSYALIGGGVSACGTSLLVLMAKRVPAPRRASAATVVWMMMIAGFAITASVSGQLLDPYGPMRLVAVAAGISALAFAVTVAAMWRLEGVASRGQASTSIESTRARANKFREALSQVWAEPDARRFTGFVLISMLAYSAQDLILEPFAGVVFQWTPGQSTQLAGTQHGGAFLGMLLVAVVTSIAKGTRIASLKGWVLGGCFASAVMMMGLACAALSGDPNWPLAQNVFLLGVANGAFSIAAIASMMSLAAQGRNGREGTRMGLWGAAQAVAFGVGGLLGTVLVDAAQSLGGTTPGIAYASVFALEALGFMVAQRLALDTAFPSHVSAPVRTATPARVVPVALPTHLVETA
ncbi:MAG: BCD family MFS transporter [Deltaproteobacteria bacterium]|nr:BCD family MFS transporter [Nannocystaceae bacterium]